MDADIRIVVVRDKQGQGEDRKGIGGQIHDERRRGDFGWGAPEVTYVIL